MTIEIKWSPLQLLGKCGCLHVRENVICTCMNQTAATYKVIVIYYVISYKEGISETQQYEPAWARKDGKA